MSNLVDRLEQAAETVEYPEFLDIAPRVEATIRRSGQTRWRAWHVAAAAVAAAVVVAGLIPGVRSEVASWLGIEGVTVERIDDGAPDPSGIGEDQDDTFDAGAEEMTVEGVAEDPFEALGLVGETTLSDASEAVGFPVDITVPLGPPDRVYVDDAGRAWLVYRPAADLPEVGGSGVGALLTVFDAAVTPGFTKQVGSPSQQVTLVNVRGNDGLWVEGQPHVVLVLDPSGGLVEDKGRIAGNALIWQEDRFTFRLEADIDLGQAVGIAESMGG